MKLIIVFKNQITHEFTEKDIDCSTLTIRGHADHITNVWKKVAGNTFVYNLDAYNAVNLDEVISIRVIN